MEVAAVQSPNPNGAATFPTVDPERVVEHLVSVCEVALGAAKADLETPGSLLHKSRYADTIQRCARFATDTQAALIVQKDVSPSLTIQEGDDESGTSLWTVPRRDRQISNV